MNRRDFLRTLTTFIVGAFIAPVTRPLPKRATQLSTLPVILTAKDTAYSKSPIEAIAPYYINYLCTIDDRFVTATLNNDSDRYTMNWIQDEPLEA